MSKTTQNQTVERKLKLLFELQTIDSKIDKIKILRGELPLQVRDLEDEVEGLETRVKNSDNEIAEFKKQIAEKKNQIKDSEQLITKYEKQQMKVRNNREFDSLNKEIEYQNLEIELSKKRIKEFKLQQNTCKEGAEKLDSEVKEKIDELDAKKAELDNIITDTQKEEEKLHKKSEKVGKSIEERLIKAYYRIRNNVKNGMAVAIVERDACGGCYNKIPPQRKLDIASRKKIIVCEHCGRVLVDPLINETVLSEEE